MKLENQVVSLELAKRLKELGVNQESLFWWIQYPNGEWVIKYKNTCFDYNGNPVCNWDLISAYTCSEFGELLPRYIKFQKYNCIFYTCIVPEGRCHVYYKPYNDFIEELCQIENTEADSRAKMLIYLLENNLTTLKESK